jgi:hypothetical protein
VLMARQGMTRARLGTMAALAITLACWQATTTTIAHAALPDGRAYELVSAADKDGGDVIGEVGHVRVSDDGNAVEYSSLRNFGDAVGGGVASSYMALRTGTGQGWATHGLYPPLPALSFQAVVSGLEGRYIGDLSRDLSSGVFLAWRPLTDAPAVANVTNFYLRDDLRTPGGGHYQLITDCPLCITPFDSVDLTTLPFYVGGTPDLDRVLFESVLNLADDARGAATKLYQWDETTQTTTLAGILPDGRPALQSTAGNGQVSLQNSITHHAISSDGRRVFFNAAPAGVSNVYMRVDGQSTVMLNRSEATNPGPPGGATYWDASQTGSRVFFTTGERLTDDAPAGGNEKLYMYDTTLPDDDPHNITAINFAKGVVGTSADGHTVYFFAGTQLIPNLPPLTSNAGLYVWHDGETRFISELPAEDQGKITDVTLIGRRTSRVSPSGDLVYLSTEPDGLFDHGTCDNTVTGACTQLYVYTIADHTLRCTSCNPAGPTGTANAITNLFVISGGGISGTHHLNRVISDDGHYVFFSTPEGLLPEDVNGKVDAYEYDTHTGTLSLISTGRGSSDSYAIETTPDGQDVYFVTRDQLTGWDIDANYDLYDARINGGLPDPTPPPPTCTGQDCHGPLAAPPTTGPVASAITKTAGNLNQHLTKNKKRPRTKRCRKGHTPKRTNGHTTCVRHTRHRKHTRNR